MSGLVGYDTDLLACRIDRAVSDLPNECSGVLEPPGLSHLFDLVADGEHSNIAFLSPADDEVVHDLESADFSFAFREGEGLFDLSCQAEHVEAVVSGYDECFFGDKQTSKGFLLD